jgi:hypothetical protein
MEIVYEKNHENNLFREEVKKVLLTKGIHL